MKKHITLSITLLACLQAHAHIPKKNIQKAIAASQHAITRGAPNAALVGAITALQEALDDICDSYVSLQELSKRLKMISSTIDAGIEDLDEELQSLANLIGDEEDLLDTASDLSSNTAIQEDIAPTTANASDTTVSTDAAEITATPMPSTDNDDKSADNDSSN